MCACREIRESIDHQEYRSAANTLFENIRTLHNQLTGCFYEARDADGRCAEFLGIILRDHDLIHENLSHIADSMQEFCFTIAGPLEVETDVPVELFATLETMNVGLDSLLSAYEERARNAFTNFECVERLDYITLLLQIWDVRLASMQAGEAGVKEFDGWRQISIFREELSNSLLKIETLARNLKRLDTVYVQSVIREILSLPLRSSPSDHVDQLTPLREVIAKVRTDETSGAPIDGGLAFDKASLTYKIQNIHGNARRLVNSFGVRVDDE
ncbi:MAG: hypothetical protein LBF66_00225 [Holosporales bacterium]|jgi:hypothetical protein|nr:hypothetical protein [Holosporales bacterium]